MIEPDTDCVKIFSTKRRVKSIKTRVLQMIFAFKIGETSQKIKRSPFFIDFYNEIQKIYQQRLRELPNAENARCLQVQ